MNKLMLASLFGLAAGALVCRAEVPVDWSFSYGGKPAAFSFKGSKPIGEDARRTRTIDAFVSPDGRLELRVTRTVYKKFPAQEYLPELVTIGSEPTEIVSDFRSIDMTFGGDVGIRALTGTKATPDDFTPRTARVGLGKGSAKEFRMVATEGRSSADWMPFWGVDFADGSGFEFALGWSGAWRADFTAEENGGVRLKAGMLKTHFRLLPGETLRMPSVLVFTRKKDVSPVKMKTLVHRFMIDEKAPRDSKGNLIRPILALTAGGGNKTPAMMRHMIDWKVKEKMPFDCFWIDAGWNGPAHQPDSVSNCGDHWWKYVGDWRMNPTVHPQGNLAEVSDAAKAAGMKTLLWVEPERCTTKPFVHPVTKAHRDWFLPTEGEKIPDGNNLCHNLGNPAACDYVIETISRLVRENRLGVYRQDFNFNTIPYWSGADAPDRVGVTEAKYVMGLYRFWDTLRERFPDLLIENCASGGRRLDFELISRSHSYCRSDYLIFFRGNAAQVTDAQNCTYNTLACQPFQGGETRPAAMFDDYGFFSTVSSGTVFTPSDWHGDRAPDGAHNGGLVTHDFTAEENDWLREVFGAADRMRPYYEGDFYPLCGAARPQSEREWCAWQLHRADLHAGFAIVFRRISVDDRYFTCALGGIDPKADYEVEFFRGKRRLMKGAELANLKVDVKTPRDFRLFFYRQHQKRIARIGLVADSHYADIPSSGSRCYRESLEKMSVAVRTFNELPCDFVVELGDLKDLTKGPKETLAALDAIEARLAAFKGDVYHVCGNHDFDCLKPEEFFAHIRNAGKTPTRGYYSFDRAGIRFIVLDACYTSDMKHYDRANPWTDANVPPEELSWLAAELASAKGAAVVFCHQLLEPSVACEGHLVRNHAAVRALLEKSGRVKTVLCGHQHTGARSALNGISYYALKSQVDGHGLANNSFAVASVFADGTVSVTGHGRAESTRTVRP